MAETPIRGRWTITRISGDAARGPHWLARATGPRVGYGQSIDVVPVPDEAAIERAAEALAAQVVVRWQDASESVRNIYRDKAREILRAALDPDARPETPEQRHHRELHDGTLNEMPPETRHA